MIGLETDQDRPRAWQRTIHHRGRRYDLSATKFCRRSGHPGASFLPGMAVFKCGERGWRSQRTSSREFADPVTASCNASRSRFDPTSDCFGTSSAQRLWLANLSRTPVAVAVRIMVVLRAVSDTETLHCVSDRAVLFMHQQFSRRAGTGTVGHA